jgi:hypothetical protein
LKRALPCLMLCLLALLSACDASPVVVVATPVPIDATFRTYRHPTGVFTLRLPPDWSVRDVSYGDAVRVEFSPPGNTGLPLTIYVINTGAALGTSNLLDAINRYQATINGDPSIYSEVSRNAQGDGSWRLAGVRQTPIGPRQLNTFLQADKSFLSALEVDITGATDAALQTLRAIINTFRVDPTVVIGASNILAPEGMGVNMSSGVLVFSGMYEWTNPQGAFIVNGQVVNESGVPLEGIRITCILYDAQNNALTEQANVIPVEVLENKASAAFSIQFRGGKPTQAVRYELHAAGRNAEYALRVHLGNESFILGNDKAVYSAGGYLTISGDVVNKTQGAAHFVKANVIVYDEQQRVVATDSAFVSKPDLLPGETAHFEVPFYELAGNAVRYQISIEGKTQ